MSASSYGPSATGRTTQKTVVFERPFYLTGLGQQPPGTYTIETDEELLVAVSFPAYRRVLTLIHLHEVPGDPRITGIAKIDPDELEAALKQDSQHRSNSD